MATSTIKLTFGFEDDTKRDLTLGPFATNSAAVTGAKANVKAFNEMDIPSIEGLILSDDGASCTGIAAASVITVNETEINLYDDKDYNP